MTKGSRFGMETCGSAAAHGGKPPAYRQAPQKTQEAPPPLLENPRHSLGKRRVLDRKAGGFPPCAAAKPLQKQNRRHGLNSRASAGGFYLSQVATCATSKYAAGRRLAARYRK